MTGKSEAAGDRGGVIRNGSAKRGRTICRCHPKVCASSEVALRAFAARKEARIVGKNGEPFVGAKAD